MNRFVQFSLIALALNWPAWGQIQQSRTAQGARLITAAARHDRDDKDHRDQDRDRDRDRDQDRNRVYQDRDRDRDNDAYYDRDNREYGRGGSYGRNSQWRGRNTRHCHDHGLGPDRR